MLAADIAAEIESCADPVGAATAIERMQSLRPDARELLSTDAAVARAVVAVAAASPWLGRVLGSDDDALAVLTRLEEPVIVEDHLDLARLRRLEVLRIAARDLLGIDGLEDVTASLSSLADRILRLAAQLGEGLAIIAMGKLGARELNYSSDLDLLLVANTVRPAEVRSVLDAARRAWRIDLDLRPEGRAGPVARTLDSYRSYWDRWAEPWEFQALIKARAVGGDEELGRRFEAEAAQRLWSRTFGSEELYQLRRMKSRAERELSVHGVSDREIKRGSGGIRDIEFAVQLLQMVHGRVDPSLREPSTLGALRALSSGGYVDSTDAEDLEAAYRWLRTVEHRLQLREDQQVHLLPSDAEARARLARVLGYRDRGYETALGQFESELRRHQATARRIHERLFFRPLLEAFSAQSQPSGPLSEAVATQRLVAFGFTDAARTRQAVRELTRGFSRSSQLMQQMLPLLFEWLSDSPDPDLGLLGLRSLATTSQTSAPLRALCRESPEAASRLCLLLGTVRHLARDLQRHPEVLADLASADALAPEKRSDLDKRLGSSLAWRSGPGATEEGLRLFAGAAKIRIVFRDVLGFAEEAETARGLSDLAESMIAAAVRIADPPLPFGVVAMGRLGGRELGYASDLDLMFVYDLPAGTEPAEAASRAEATATRIVRLVSGGTPAIFRVDTALRPEGRQGPQARSLAAFEAYYRRWAEVWERQALLRSRYVAGDERLGEAFEALTAQFIWNGAFGPEETRAIRRMKARMERERILAGEDPQFHLKLGPGSLSDVEWTAQLLQLQNNVRACGTLAALEDLAAAGVLTSDDAGVLATSWRFCERVRNRLALISEAPSDSLPGSGSRLTVLARSLGTSGSALRDDFRRVTRRARRVVERTFYDRGSLR
jgi:glutamate-ammonia-ligase adenylyltransferase